MLSPFKSLPTYKNLIEFARLVASGANRHAGYTSIFTRYSMEIKPRKQKLLRWFLGTICLVLAIIFIRTNLNIEASGQQPKKSDQTNRTSLKEDSKQLLSMVEERNTVRKRRIRNFCLNRNTTASTSKLYDIRAMTDPSYSFLYCRVNKAASTSVVKYLERIFNRSADSMREAAQVLHQWPAERVNDFLDNSYKFMFVREPYGRLFSTYCNKFYFPKGNWVPISIDIITRCRKNPSADSLKYGHDVTFSELICYVVDLFESGDEADIEEHIRPQHVHCHSCLFEYDFIGKLETKESDWNYIEEELKRRGPVSQKIQVQHGERWYTTRTTLFWFHQTLDKLKSSNISFYSLYERAWAYFQITGRISKNVSMPFRSSDHIRYGVFWNALMTEASSKLPTSLARDQKREAMLDAYSTISVDYMERLRKVFMTDCLLYGYNNPPEWLFSINRTMVNGNSFGKFSYFKGLPQTPLE